MLEELLKQTNTFIFVKDKKLRYIYCTENFAEAIGVDSPVQIVGKTDYELFTDSIADVYRQGDLNIFKGMHYRNRKELFPYRGQDKQLEVLVSKNKRCYSDGFPSGLVGSFVDITDIEICTAPTLNFRFDARTKRYYFPHSINGILPAS